MKIIDKTKVSDGFYGYLKENWNGCIDKSNNELWTNRLKLPWTKIAKINIYLKEDEDNFSGRKCNIINIEIRKKYVNYKDLKNVIKSFENSHNDIKVSLEIIYDFEY